MPTYRIIGSPRAKCNYVFYKTNKITGLLEERTNDKLHIKLNKSNSCKYYKLDYGTVDYEVTKKWLIFEIEKTPILPKRKLCKDCEYWYYEIYRSNCNE